MLYYKIIYNHHSAFYFMEMLSLVIITNKFKGGYILLLRLCFTAAKQARIALESMISTFLKRQTFKFPVFQGL